MGDIFRSEKMALCQMFIQPEAAYTSLSELGEIGCMHFRDLNNDINAFQRKFVTEVRRCEELERIVRYIEGELRKDDFKVTELIDDIPRAPKPSAIGDLENCLEKAEREIFELSQNEIKLKTNCMKLTELAEAVVMTQIFLSQQEANDIDINALNGDDTNMQQRARLAFVTGVINRERSFAFERMLWRISHGNILLKRADLEQTMKDPQTGSLVYKTFFVVFFQGEALQNRIKKICTGFHVSLYNCPSSLAEREKMLKDVRSRLEDLRIVLKQTADYRKKVLVSVSKDLPLWTVLITKMKAIYHNLNLFNMDVSNKCLIGEGWVPILDIPRVRQALLDGSDAVGSTVPAFLNEIDTNKQPPTYYRTNKFTQGFQSLVDAYGMASYREVNPGLYTCITFPFLFAVMFGDMGHGFLIFLFGLWMVICEEKLNKIRDEVVRKFFAGRYNIMLMGLFSIYTGFIYNDIFSQSINVFGSGWRVHYNRTTVLTNPNLQLDPKYSTDFVYPMGIDPIWQLAANKLIFLNTYKMKLSIIFGVTHMIFGVCMSVANFVHFKRYSLIILEFIPQIIFLLLLFGYMCFMMFMKWAKYSATSTELANTPGCAPSVLIYFINMVLFKSTPTLPGCEMYMFDGQRTLETVFVVVALICIPWILVGKPLYIRYTRQVQAKRLEKFTEQAVSAECDTSVEISMNGDTVDEAEEESINDIWIHQAIHTIEYILSTISHTASYLRLWALSLAHAELSEVLWSRVLHYSFILPGFYSTITLYCIFSVWAVLTIAIMLMMEGLSAFLHTLRLHWVEFMSKFYEGTGYAFQPFSFKLILEDGEED